jgi:hypothetical protein
VTNGCLPRAHAARPSALLMCQGSASTIWRRRSFFDDGFDGATLPLYAAPTASAASVWDDAERRSGAAGHARLAAAGAAPPSPRANEAHHAATTVAAVGSWARGFGRMVLDSVDASAASREGGFAEDAWATPGPGTGQRQAGLHMLHRSVGQLCAHELGVAGAPPPPQWGPFALLAALCAGLARPQPRDGAGVLLNAAGAATTPGAAPALVRVAEEEDSDGACCATVPDGMRSTTLLTRSAHAPTRRRWLGACG